MTESQEPYLLPGPPTESSVEKAIALRTVP